MAGGKTDGDTSLSGEFRKVLDPRKAASYETETLLRTNPFTAPAAFISDYVGDPPPSAHRDAVHYFFENPEELGLGPDTKDLPLGSVRDPLNIDPGPEGPTGGRDDPVVPRSISERTGVLGLLVLLGVGFIFLSALAEGIGEGLTS